MNLNQFIHLLTQHGIDPEKQDAMVSDFINLAQASASAQVEPGSYHEQSTQFDESLHLERPADLDHPTQIDQTGKNIKAPDDPTGNDELLNLTQTRNLAKPRLSQPKPSELAASNQYEDLDRLGYGGMGEVRLVKDPVLNRHLAMKVLHRNMLQKGANSARFVEEAQICAQLEHPNIVPIHELGTLPDGRLYFTMKQVKGRQMGEVVKRVHDVSTNGRWGSTECGWNLYRLLDAFHQVCRAMAFAHSKGVIHRDLKPSNIMMGEFGEVLVLDWGIAKVIGSERFGRIDPVYTERSKSNVHATRSGEIIGTAAYMSPEQASGNSEAHDSRTDVYALGGILYHLLCSAHPYSGTDFMTTLKMVQTVPPVKIRDISVLPIPDELLEICETAMARNPEERYASANELALSVSAWLDGSRQREKGLSVVLQAQNMMLERQQLRAEAEALNELADAGLKAVPSWADEDTKGKWWDKQQQAIEKQENLRRLDIEQEQLLQAALTHKSDLGEAHQLLIERYRKAHEDAELIQDDQACERHAIRLKHHAESLPESSPIRAAQLYYLKGTGALSLCTDVPDVAIFLDKYVPYRRRLVAKQVAELGNGPVIEYPLEMGSYRIRLKKIGHHDVVYPIYIGRGEHWNGIDPSGHQRPVHVPISGSIGENEQYVPAGWFQIGGRNEGEYTFKRRRVWKESFIMQTFPVTNTLYLSFLNALVVSDRCADAMNWSPRERSGQSDQQGSMIYAQDEVGQFQLVPDSEGDTWGLNWPVCLVDWHGASAFAEWFSAKTGHAWLLPDELSWEKAARGVDGRNFPWGADFDPSYACTVDSHSNRVRPQDVDSFPVDASVYGIRGLAGNMMDWTSSPWKKAWEGTKDENMYCIRGGSCGRSFSVSRSANRFPFLSTGRTHFLSFRLIRPIVNK